MDITRENAGFRILLSKTVGDGLEVVLGQRLPDGWYVTWLCSNGTDYSWGHYFDDTQLLNALRDFIERSERFCWRPTASAASSSPAAGLHQKEE